MDEDNSYALILKKVNSKKKEKRKRKRKTNLIKANSRIAHACIET